MLGSVIFILAFIAGLLLASFIFIKGIRWRKALLDRFLITIGSLMILVPSVLIGFVGIWDLPCEIYRNALESQIEKLDRSCQNESDCMLIMYYPCTPFCVNSSINMSSFYDDFGRTRPGSCGLYSCIAPERNYECACINGTCTLKEKGNSSQ